MKEKKYGREIVIKIRIFFNANILKIMMTWKIVGASKVSVLYIYIYIDYY